MKHFFPFLIVLVLLSCEKDVTFHFDLPAKLCLNCLLDPDSTITARLTLSGNIENNSSFQPVDDAVIVFYEDGTLLDTLTSGGEGNYYLKYYPESLSEYEIVVLHPDFKKLTAATRVPQKPTVYHYPDTLSYVEGFYYRLNVYFEIHDIPGPNSYWPYRKYTRQGAILTSSPGEIQSPFIDDFNRDLDSDSEYGFLYAYAVRITDAGNDGNILHFNTFIISGQFFNIYSVDEHYDKYIKSSVKARFNNENELPLKESVQIYSNIENGYGIFGSSAVTRIKL